MKKLLLVAVATTTLASISQATETFSGGYAGVQLGLSAAKVEQKDTSSADIHSVTSGGFSGFMGTALAGYGQVADSFYAGAELRVGMATGSGKLTAVGTASATSYTPKESTIVAGRAGYLLTQKAMVFAALGAGLENSVYKVEANGKSLESSKRDLVIVPGVGTEIAVSESLNFRADFNYTLGKKRTLDGTALAAAGITDYKEVSFTPTRAAFTMGLSYRF